MKFVFATFLLTVGAIASLVAQAPADLILLNGKIFTSDPSRPNVAALAVRDSRIQATGESEEMRKLAGPKTRIVDLGQRTVVPGFNDAHAHFGPMFQGIDLEFKTYEPSWAETQAAIEKAVATGPKGKWIFGTVGEAVINDLTANRAALDRIAPENPVLLSTYFGHGAIINSRGLEFFKISDSMKDPAGGSLERDQATKKMTGRMFEYAAWNLDRILAEQGTDEQLIANFQKRAANAASLGITSIQIMPSLSNKRFVKILNAAKSPIRVRAIAFSRTSADGRDPSDIRALAISKTSSPNISVSGIKWILDGTPIERGAAMRTAYLDKPGSTGQLNFAPSEVEKIVRESLDLDQQLLIHAVGDRAVATLLDAMEKVGVERKVNWPAKRIRIEHGEGVSADLIERARKLGVIVVQNPSHFTVVQVIHTRWGKDTKLSPQRSLLDAGVRYAIGSDGPINPFLNIMFATIHPARPTEAITLEEAVRAYTTGSAYAEFAETEKGMLRPGMLADLAVLSQDIFTVAPDALPGTTSVLTIVGGRIVHDANVIR